MGKDQLKGECKVDKTKDEHTMKESGRMELLTTYESELVGYYILYDRCTAFACQDFSLN